MIQLHAQPYDISAGGFYFQTVKEYQAKAKQNLNDYGDPVEEYEIQFIDGETIDCDLAKAWGLNQVNFAEFFNKAEEWNDDQKTRYILAVGECGYEHSKVADDPKSIDIIIYESDSLADLAEQFVDEGLFGEIPEHLAHYIDFEAIARDLSVDYSPTCVNGNHFYYHCA